MRRGVAQFGFLLSSSCSSSTCFSSPSASSPLVAPRRTFLGLTRSGGKEETSDTPLLSGMHGKPVVYFTIEEGRGNVLGTIKIELESELLPRATENFLALCTGAYATFSSPPDTPTAQLDRSLKVGNLHYKFTNFHRVLPGFLIQGGDNEYYDGTGGWCALRGLKYFEDESYEVPFDKPGVVGMAVEAPNRNASQFFITTAPAPHLQKKCVAVGRVTEGMEVVHAIEKTPVDHMDRPTNHIKIIDCGVVNS